MKNLTLNITLNTNINTNNIINTINATMWHWEPNFSCLGLHLSEMVEEEGKLTCPLSVGQVDEKGDLTLLLKMFDDIEGVTEVTID